MEVPYLHPMSQRAYHSPPSHYEDDDIISRSSYNIPVSNASGSTITFEAAPSGRCSTAPRQRVRDMVKMFEGSSSNLATTPVHRAESTVFTPSKPVYSGAARGNSTSYAGSQASVKQYVSQLQDVDETVKGNEKCRRNLAVGRCAGGTVVKQYLPQYQETEEQIKLAEKARRYVGSSCPVVTGYTGSQTSVKPFIQQFQDNDEPSKTTERCPRCNVLYRCDEIHYCLGIKPGFTGSEQNRVSRNELECANSKPNSGIQLGHLGSNSNGYSGFAENRNNDVLRSPSKELSESRARESRQNPTDLYEEIDGIPVSLAYDSKTTILRTQEGVRIVVDISIDSMSSLSAADVICSRVETEMPHSRILTEFQQKSAMIMAGDENRL